MLFSSVRSCRDAAALILAREDRPLDWRERSLLAMHLHLCEACPRFASQIGLMREAFGRWRRHAEVDPSPEAGPTRQTRS